MINQDIHRLECADYVKTIIRGESIAHRPQIKHEISFNPTHTLLLCTGKLPTKHIEEGSDMFRSLQMISFPFKFPSNTNNY